MLPAFGGYEAYLDMEPHVVERFMLAWRGQKEADAELEKRTDPPKGPPSDE